MYVQGGWSWVGEDQGLDREARAVDAVLGYPWEGDVDAGEQLALALWAISSRSDGIFGILEPMGPNLQTQNNDEGGADEEYQMEPPESSVMRLQLCAEARLWISSGSDLLDVRALPYFSVVI